MQQKIIIGFANNDGLGDPLRVAMAKIEDNFDELYGYFTTNGSITLLSNPASTANTIINYQGPVMAANATANAVVNATSITFSDSANNATMNASGIGVGANVVVNSTALFVGNSTVYSNITATGSGFIGPVALSNTIVANGSAGGAGQVLTSNGTGVYWSTVTGGGSVDTTAQYTWTNTQNFNSNVYINYVLSVNTIIATTAGWS